MSLFKNSSTKLEINKVLVKKLAFEGRHKIEYKYEPDTYIILEQRRPDMPVLKIDKVTV